MKKIICILMAVLLCSVVLVSCKSAQEYYPIEQCGHSASVPEIKSEHNTKWSSESFSDESARKTVTVTVRGQQYTGEYKQSYFNPPDFFQVDEYKIPGKSMEFEVYHDTGELVGFAWGTVSEPESGKKYSEEECVQIAKDLAGDYIDVSQYTISIRHRYDVYEVEFTKYIEDYETGDCTNVTVQENGNIVGFYSFLRGKVNKDDLPEFDMEKVRRTVNHALDKKCAKAKKVYTSVTYENYSDVIIVLNNSKYAIYCTVSVNCNNKLDGEIQEERGELLSFVVMIS